MYHLVFDFVEKVLHSRLVCQPRQLYFITGPEYHLFGLQNSSNARKAIYCLNEGHLMNEKTGNAVILCFIIRFNGVQLTYAHQLRQNIETFRRKLRWPKQK